MTSEQLQSARKTAQSCATFYRLPLGSQNWRGSAGDFAGNGVGSSMDFQDQRLYAPGDDPRHINWQAYARTGQYTMKLYREEVRPLIDLIVDVSPSMFFDPIKAQRTAELLTLFVLLGEQSGASLRTTLISGAEVRNLASREVLDQKWWPLAEELQNCDPNTPPAVERIPLRATALRLVLSDLLFPGNPEASLRRLTARKGRLHLFTPYLQSEEQPNWSGNYEFVDAESQSRHRCRVQTSQLSSYRQAYQQHFALWEECARKHQATLSRVPSENDLTSALRANALNKGALELRN